MNSRGPSPLNREYLDDALSRFQTRLERRIQGLRVWWLPALLVQTGLILDGVYFLLTRYRP